MARNMTADIYADGQACYVGRRLLDIYSKAGNSSAKALRAYAQSVYPVKHFLLKLCVQRLRVSDRNIAAERFFGKVCALFKVAAYAYTNNYRRTWV